MIVVMMPPWRYLTRIARSHLGAGWQ
jgi:hypothetical protein